MNKTLLNTLIGVGMSIVIALLAYKYGFNCGMELGAEMGEQEIIDSFETALDEFKDKTEINETRYYTYTDTTGENVKISVTRID